MAKFNAKKVGPEPKAEAPVVAGVQARPLKPGQCKAHMRKRLAEEFGGIVDGFVKQAKSGSCPHVKLATELVAEPLRLRRRKTAAERLLEGLAKKPVHARQVHGQHGRGMDGKYAAGV